MFYFELRTPSNKEKCNLKKKQIKYSVLIGNGLLNVMGHLELSKMILRKIWYKYFNYTFIILFVYIVKQTIIISWSCHRKILEMEDYFFTYWIFCKIICHLNKNISWMSQLDYIRLCILLGVLCNVTLSAISHVSPIKTCLFNLQLFESSLK